MRKTITLDNDVNAMLRSAMRERGMTLKQVVNEAIRNALKEPTMKRGPAKKAPFQK